MSEFVDNNNDTVKGPPIHLFTEDRLHVHYAPMRPRRKVLNEKL